MTTVLVYDTEQPLETRKMGWPFLIKKLGVYSLGHYACTTQKKGFLEGPPCTKSPPDTLAALLWAITAVFGVVYALLGYRCLRAVGFLTGLFIGVNGVVMFRQYYIPILGEPTDSALAIIAGLVGAILGATYPIATTLISAFAGALVAGTAMTVCVATMPGNQFGHGEITAALIGGAGIFAILTLCSAKYVTILTSSIVGSAMIIASVDFFLHGLELLHWIFNIKPHPNPPACYGGILICSWPVAIIVSIIIQCFITAWGIDHHKRILHHRHQQLTHIQKTPREAREEARQLKFRYLYQIRTARGDIISQNFVSALQKRIQLSGIDTPSERSLKTGSNERNTFRSDRTHFTTIPPDSDMFDKIELVRDIA